MDNFTQLIYQWYSKFKRDLPWRQTSDPYKIWISEIILQQTRVAQGTEYYKRFISEFPTIYKLADASEDQVLKLWQGLGYYTRARNIHFTAKYVVNNYKGKFPKNYKTILLLKGIGPYTAAAISSIAFKLPHAAVDGNIYRILSRYFGVSELIDSNKGKIEIQKIADEIILQTNPGFHNQALMEFGALQCIPKSPDCKICPLHETCFAFNNNLVEILPTKSKKTKQRNRYFYYLLVANENSIYLEKRENKDIWKNLYQLPLIETEKELADAEIMTLNLPFPKNAELNLKSISPRKKHILSHQIIYARVLYFESNKTNLVTSNFIRVNKKDIYKFAIPKLLEEFLTELDFLGN